MAGHPKKKHSHAVQGKRRSHLALKAVALTPCPQCGTLKRPHEACARCGTYRGRRIITIKTKRAAPGPA
ncbi:MAG: 50S ribosomal protein L32 [Chloroflexi bacterium]|nr:50S ribosomal protein L32 [Chloroflexota bacterium]